MAEDQRQPVPFNDGGELDTALAFLRFSRQCLLKKLDGLTDEQVRRVLVDSGTNLLGLVQHSTVGERYWFRHHLLGEYDDIGEDDWDFEMDVPADQSTADVVHEYRRAAAESDAAIASIGDPDARMARTVNGSHLSLRWVLAHMTSETARHAGHADILREQLDGATGR
jgi:hypothetical protein